MNHRDWDQPLALPQEQEKLPPGGYEFKMLGWDGGVTQGGTPYIEVRLDIDGQTIRHRLWDTDKADWKMYEFWTATGVRKHGEKMSVRRGFDASIGQTGRCEVVHNDNGYVEIKEFLDPTDVPF